jgi:inorganic pyrophosphatase
MDEETRFWNHADRLVAAHPIVIDRPGGTAHPRFPALIYPFDYGYLDGTGAVDGGGVDCWRGSLPEPVVTGAIVTVDTHKADSEVKWLIGCTPEEMALALATHRTEWQAAILIPRPIGPSDLPLD